MKIPAIYKTITILSILGILLALFLYYEYLFQPAFRPCSVNATVNCDAVISGPIKTFLGVPVSLIGLLGYIVIFFAALFKKSSVVLGTVVFGMLFCIRLIFLEVFVIHVICPVCISCFIVMTAILILALRLVSAEKKQKTTK